MKVLKSEQHGKMKTGLGNGCALALRLFEGAFGQCPPKARSKNGVQYQERIAVLNIWKHRDNMVNFLRLTGPTSAGTSLSRENGSVTTVVSLVFRHFDWPDGRAYLQLEVSTVLRTPNGVVNFPDNFPKEVGWETVAAGHTGQQLAVEFFQQQDIVGISNQGVLKESVVSTWAATTGGLVAKILAFMQQARLHRPKTTKRLAKLAKTTRKRKKPTTAVSLPAAPPPDTAWDALSK